MVCVVPKAAAPVLLGTFTTQAIPPLLNADGSPVSSIVGWFVLSDLSPKYPFGGYANSQYFAGGDPTVGLPVTGLQVGQTYYYVVCASTDGITPGISSTEMSAST